MADYYVILDVVGWLEMEFKKMLKIAKTRKALVLLALRVFLGGDKRDRTADLLNAIQALSQPTQSYTLEIEEKLP